VVRAIETGAGAVETWRNPETFASGIRVPGSRAGRQIIEGLRDTGGTAVAVSDGDIIAAAGMMAAFSGVFPSPEGAAALAGLISLLGSGRVDPSDRVVLVNTAGWSRYRFMLDPFSGGPSVSL
jgi:threonine synthase